MKKTIDILMNGKLEIEFVEIDFGLPVIEIVSTNGRNTRKQFILLNKEQTDELIKTLQGMQGNF